MEKEFIPYEQALALKELGFDEPCFGWYSNMDGNVFRQGYCETYLGIENCAKAPIYQQAFRWFREVCNIQSYVKLIGLQYSFKIRFQKLANGENPPTMVWHHLDSWLGLHLDLFVTYEEAEFVCLTKSIEIVETKSE